MRVTGFVIVVLWSITLEGQDLSVTKRLSSDLAIGVSATSQPGAFSIFVSNAGPADASAVTLIVDGVTDVTAALRWSCTTATSNRVTCTVASFPTGTRIRFSAAGKSSSLCPARSYTVSASISSSRPDGQPQDNSATASFSIPAPNLHLSLITPATVATGAVFQVEAQLTSVPASAWMQVLPVTVTISPNSSFLYSGGAPVGCFAPQPGKSGIIRCLKFGPVDSVRYSFSLKAPAAPSSIGYPIHAEISSACTDQLASDNTATRLVKVQ